MPHKHKRKRVDDDLSFDLPPTQKALALPVTLGGKVQKGKGKGKGKGKASAPAVPNKRHQTTMKDDTPRAFKRLMRVAQGGKRRSGLDDGLPKSDGANSGKAKTEVPTIKPGEDLRSFASRVDASLPVSGLTSKTIVKDGKDSLGLKVRRTRREKKLHKLYDQWRVEDEKIQDRKEEEKDLAEEKELDDEASGVSWNSVVGNAQARRKGGKGRRDAADDDPWAELAKKRGKASNGLHDVALAPPELHKKQTRLLSIRDAAVEVGSAPKAAGSLRQREQLEKTRQEVVDAYRKIREHEQKKLEAQASK